MYTFVEFGNENGADLLSELLWQTSCLDDSQQGVVLTASMKLYEEYLAKSGECGYFKIIGIQNECDW